MANQRQWGGSLHQTFRLLPEANENLRVFLNADGTSADQVLARLPYAAARARGEGTGRPDPKRYRDGRHVFQTVGLLFEEDQIVNVTDLGRATLRWIGKLSPVNSVVLGRHAAYALTACQLRNPTRAGLNYDVDVEVFPFTFIWRAMLALDNRINSNELNRVLFRVTDEESLLSAIDRIADCRYNSSPPEALGAETITGAGKNDRLIPWMALASFGWLLIADKREAGGEWYEVRPRAKELIHEASQMRRTHRDFTSPSEYALHISDAACLPKDVR
jgi:hypothetical protein